MPPITPHQQQTFEVAGGVDTHQDTHTAAVIDTVGRVLGTEQFPATPAGYTALLAWMRSFGELTRVGVEGTGAYGAGLAQVLRDNDICVIEVDRPDRKTRRFHGKSDPIDAIQAAKTAVAGDRTGTPQQRDGRVEALRNLRVARRSAVDQRADAQRQIKALIITAPRELRERLRGLPVTKLVATCVTMRPDPADAANPATAATIALRSLARRHQQLSVEIIDLDQLVHPLGGCHQPPSGRRQRSRRRRRWPTAGHRRAEPRPARLRGGVRHALRCGAHSCLLRQDHPPPPQSRWRPTR